jgi:hypothetical protein
MEELQRLRIQTDLPREASKNGVTKDIEPKKNAPSDNRAKPNRQYAGRAAASLGVRTYETNPTKIV